MIYKQAKFNIASVFFTVVLFCCFSFQFYRAEAKSVNKLYQSFFISSDNTQYFIKPLKFVGKGKQLPLLMDFTFRDKNYKEDSTIVNFTFMNEEIVKKADSLIFVNREFHVKIFNISHIYTDRVKNKYESRFTSSTRTYFIEQLFEKDQWIIKLYVKGKEYIYRSPKRTIKSIRLLNKNIFAIIRE